MPFGRKMGPCKFLVQQKLHLLTAVVFVVAVVLIQNQIQKLEESRVTLENTILRRRLDEAEHGVGEEELPLNEEDDVIVIYNRVPKTASTSFTNIAYDLCTENHFHVMHINISNYRLVLSVQDQMNLVKNISYWTEKRPGFYHGHMAYLDFSRYGVKVKPLYINMVRDPIERLVSHYYFLRFGDDFKPGFQRKRHGNNETFDECVSSGGADCHPKNLWMQVPFFCGHVSECWNVGSRWALEQAKYNLMNQYLLVGMTEELEDFITILEAVLPRFFKGATDLYKTSDKFHLRKTIVKKPLANETIAKLQESDIWKVENEFYVFVQEYFQFVRSHAVKTIDGGLQIKPKSFFYAKIYPKVK